MASRTFSFARHATKSISTNNINKFTRSWFPTTSQIHRQVTTVVNATNAVYPPYLPLFAFVAPKTLVNLVDFTSTEGKRLFRGAMDQGQAESFFKLMGNFSTQSSPALAGVSSLAMALNALEIDPKRIWKGNWRWFSGDQLKTCSPKEAMYKHGIPFDEFTCLAQTHCNVEPKRASVGGYSQFLLDLERVTSNPDSQMVVNYARSHLGQQGEGHFSPIGGHNSKDGMTLIMDVARVKYPSVWVDSRTLYESMLLQEESGGSRGYFLLTPGQKAPALVSSGPSGNRPLKCNQCSRLCSKKKSS
ncbi:Phytochelatin synthase-domain-containing protein [Phycomyces nitens]|nr:Phytochelatin synthase-domain-containing protein [Phycomyces nitens]